MTELPPSTTLPSAAIRTVRPWWAGSEYPARRLSGPGPATGARPSPAGWRAGRQVRANGSGAC
jgi:hypothetical protein